MPTYRLYVYDCKKAEKYKLTKFQHKRHQTMSEMRCGNY